MVVVVVVTVVLVVVVVVVVVTVTLFPVSPNRHSCSTATFIPKRLCQLHCCHVTTIGHFHENQSSGSNIIRQRGRRMDLIARKLHFQIHYTTLKHQQNAQIYSSHVYGPISNVTQFSAVSFLSKLRGTRNANKLSLFIQ